MNRLVIFILFAVISLSSQAQKAQDILEKSAEAYQQANGVHVDFDLHTRSDKQQISESFEGTIDMNGEKFLLKTPDMFIWFDGHTQWTYLPRNEEVNITEPSGDELLQINPILLLGSYRKSFNASFNGESTSPNGKAAYDITLISKSKKKADKIELQIEKNSYLPSRIVFISGNGFRTSITIRKMQTGLNHSSKYFVFKKSDFPDVEVIDLR